RQAGLRRRPVLVAGDAHDAAHALGDEVVAAAMRVGARGPEAGDRAVDQAWVDRPELVPVDAQAPRGAGTIVLHEHVGGLHQAMDDLDARRPLEIDGDPALAAVHREEGAAVAVLAGRAAAHVLAAGRL